MAGKYDEYEKILYGNKSSQSQLAKNQGTIANYSARLAAGGVNPEQVTDNRNWLEKALNLTPNQNALFDIFELMQRPQQAIWGGIENMQQGGDFLEGAKEGIKGNKDTSFKDILMNTGMFDDTTYEDLIKQGESGGIGTRLKALDLVDILGLGGDVFLDPMDIPLIPVSAAAKGAKALDAASDVAKAANVVDTASDAIKFISPTQALGKAAKAGIKKGAKFADTNLEKLFKTIDKASGTIYTAPEAKWASELGKMGDGRSLLETYKGLKNNITTMFSTKLSKGARQAQKLNDAQEYLLRMHLGENAKGLDEALDNTVNVFMSKGINKTKEEVARDINKIRDVVSEISLRDVINGAQNGSVKYSDEIVNGLKDMITDLRKTDAEKLLSQISKTDDGFLKLGDDWFDILENTDKANPSIYKSMFDTEKLQSKVNRVSLYSADELKDIENLTKLYQDNVPEVLEQFQKFYDDGNKLIEDTFSSFKGLGDKFDNVNYSKHVLSGDYEDNIIKLSKKYGVDADKLENFLPSGSGMGTGAGTLNTRMYQMPAGEANKLRQQQLLKLPNLSEDAQNFIKNDIKLFEDSAMAGVSKYIEDMPKYAKNTQMMDEVLINQGFGDVKKMRELRDSLRSGVDASGETIDRAKVIKEYNQILDSTPFRLLDDGKAPAGFVKVDQDTKNYIVRFLQSTGDKTGNKNLVDMAQQFKYLDNMAVDPTVLNILKFNTDTARKNEFIKFYDGLMNWFKGNKTASFTNQMNNISGNTMNMLMSGMDMKDYAKYTSQAVSDLHNFEDILRKGVTDLSQLTPEQQKIYRNLELFSEFVSTPDAATLAKKYDLEGVIKKLDKKGNKLPLDPVRKAFANANAAEDRIFKYALFTKAMDDPKFVKSLGVVIDGADDLARAKAAGEVVSKVLFDPSDLTAFEQNVMKRVVPFYTFTKKNLAFQISNMGDNLQNYNKLMKAYNSLTNSYGEAYDNMPDYLKDNMYIPIPVIGKDGKYQFVRAQLPFGDLTDIVSNPINSLVNRTSSIIKLPFELATGTNVFTGRPISEQGNIDILSRIPGVNTGKGQEILSSLTGLDTPLKQLDRGITAVREGNPLDMLTNNLTIGGNVDTDRLNRSYEQIEELQNLMKQYKNQGYQFSTMTELKQANKNGTIAGIDAIFAKYGIDTNTSRKQDPYSEYEKLLYGR